MNSITVKSNIHDYQIHFESDFSFLQNLLSTGNAIFIVDENILTLYPSIGNQIDKQRLITFKAIEENKTLSSVENFLDSIMEKKPNKKTTIISIGGGITQDVSGFAASIFYRGIRWLYVPTTLLAQADSCMGSKTSLNFKSIKNILGTFYPPHEIYICPDFLLSLRKEDFYSGMGEVAKLHLMANNSSASNLISNLDAVSNLDIPVILGLIKKSLEIKRTYMEGDEFDTGRRNLLNYGHCFGHAIESATKYKIPHGQAIIAGMIIANSISVEKWLIPEKMKDNFNELLLLPLLKSDYKMLKTIAAEDIISNMKQDKKRINVGLPLIMLCSDHSLTKITDLTEDEAQIAFLKFVEKFCQ